MIEQQAIADILVITPPRFADSRGWFSETWNQSKLDALGFTETFVQDNHSFSARRGTIRGLHCQAAPYVQGKLVRCVRGAIWDVAVDIRHGSASFGQFVAVELSAENGRQLWIPGGFLHGFCTIEPETEVVYKVTAPYDKASERGVIWNDPDLALPWPIPADGALLSDKDNLLPHLEEADPWFRL